MIDLAGTSDFVVQADNMDVLPTLPDGAFQLIYIDPPFNTGSSRLRRTLRSVREADGTGDRTGFRGNRYSTEVTGRMSYPDSFVDYAEFIGPRLDEARRLLADSGTLYFHIDWREAHYCKVLLDQVFGRENFLNEVIWAYDFGGRAKDRWPAKHDTILVYVKQVGAHLFDQDAHRAGALHRARRWWAPRRPRAASCRPTSGGTRSCRRGAGRRPATRTRSPRGCSAGSSSRRRARGLGARLLRRQRYDGRGGRRDGPPVRPRGLNPEAVAVMRRRLDADRTAYLDGDGLPLD